LDYLKKTVYDAMEQRRPELWRRCYPRIYAEEPKCGKYYSPKEVSYQLLGTALRVEQEGVAGQTSQAEILWASRLSSLRVPLYWIGHDMAQAIQQTVPPVEFDWVGTPLPFEAMALMVPKGTLCHGQPDEGEAVFVSFTREKKGDEVPSLSPGGPRVYNILGDAFSCFATTSRDALMHWTYSTKDSQSMGKVNLAELDTLVQTFAGHDHMSYSMYSASLTEEDNRFMARVSHFIFGTLLMLLAKPEFVTRGGLKKRVLTKAPGLPPKEFWEPNVLGLHYKIRRLYVPQGGTHQSPRLHWVRGAYKEQAYGEKRSLRKTIWVEPYLRGAD
jgi:hypothetical protein